MIAAYIYRKILEKLDLSKKDLQKLKNYLNERNICYGPFVKGNKMCPTTIALSIKLRTRKFKNNKIVNEKLKELGIDKLKLYLFYLTFDLPAMFSQKYFTNCLRNFQKVADTLIRQST